MRFICLQFVIHDNHQRVNGWVSIYNHRFYEYIQGYWMEICLGTEFYFYNADTRQIYHYSQGRTHVIQSTDDWLDVQGKSLYVYQNQGWDPKPYPPVELFMKCISVTQETSYILDLPYEYSINPDNQLKFNSSGVVDLRELAPGQSMIVSYLSYECQSLISYRYIFTRWPACQSSQRIAYTGVYEGQLWKTILLTGLQVDMVDGLPVIQIATPADYLILVQLTYARGPFCETHVPSIQAYLYQNDELRGQSALNEIRTNTILSQMDQPMNLGCVSFSLTLPGKLGDIFRIGTHQLSLSGYTLLHGNISVHNIS